MGKIHKFKGTEGSFDWEDVVIQTYPDESARDVSKREVIGPHDGAHNFAIRYFEVGPGGSTSLDQHSHDHGVIVVRGEGRVLLNGEKHPIAYGDAIYVSPHEIHQFENDTAEPLGFICVIPPK